MMALLGNPAIVAILAACGGLGGVLGFALRGGRGIMKTELVLAAEEVEAASIAMAKAKATPGLDDDAAAAKRWAAAEAHRKALRRLQGLIDGLGAVE